jgi:hypothetical protein
MGRYSHGIGNGGGTKKPPAGARPGCMGRVGNDKTVDGDMPISTILILPTSRERGWRPLLTTDVAD